MVAIDASIPVNRKRKSDEGVGCNSSPESESKKIKSEVPDLYSYPSMVCIFPLDCTVSAENNYRMGKHFLYLLQN
jgi:hypothetical protein